MLCHKVTVNKRACHVKASNGQHQNENLCTDIKKITELIKFFIAFFTERTKMLDFYCDFRKICIQTPICVQYKAIISEFTVLLYLCIQSLTVQTKPESSVCFFY